MALYKMKRSSLSSALVLTCFSAIAQEKYSDYPIQPVDFTQVHVNDNFWRLKWI